MAGLLPALPVDAWDYRVMRPADPTVLHEFEQLSRECSGKKLLLVVDQFEEVFTQLDTPEQRQSFVHALWDLVVTERAVILVTLRLDYFERCGELRVGSGRLDAIACSHEHHLFVTPLEPDQLALAITCPARQVGLEFEPGLVQRLIADVGEEPGALPLLEYVLDLLWHTRTGNQLTHSDYEAMGGVSGALARTADGIYDRLSPAAQRVARRLLLELVDLKDGAIPHTRRRVWLTQVCPRTERERTSFDAVLGELLMQRLLVCSADPASPLAGADVWLEIAHEALIRRWERLAGWIRTDRDRLTQLREVQQWADAWLSHREDQDGGASYLPTGARLDRARDLRERCGDSFSDAMNQLLQSAEGAEWRGRRRRRLTVAGLGSLAVMLLGVVLFAYRLWSKDVDRSEQTILALRQLSLAIDSLTNDEGLRDQLKEAARTHVSKPLDLDSRLTSELDAALDLAERSEGEDRRDEAKQTYEFALDNAGQLGDTLHRYRFLLRIRCGLARIAALDGDTDLVSRHHEKLEKLGVETKDAASIEELQRHNLKLASIFERRGDQALAVKFSHKADVLAAQLRPTGAVPWLPPTRGSGPRTTYHPADEYRPAMISMMGSASDERSALALAALAELEKREDFLGLAAAYLAWDRIDEAQAVMKKVPDSVGARNTWAAIRITQDRYMDALALLEEVVKQAPSLPQAHWNRALALKKLELPRSAAAEYDEVARLQAGTDWALQAQEEASTLRKRDENEARRWQHLSMAANEFVQSGNPPSEELRHSRASVLRLYFYDALRTRQSASEVMALRPFAEKLDGTGAPILVQAVERIVRRDFRVRASLAVQYAELRQANLSQERRRQLATALFQSGEDDIAVGAAIYGGIDRERLVEFTMRAQRLKDPWFDILAQRRLADHALAQGDSSLAAQRLAAALELCRVHPAVEYMCGFAEFDMAHVQLVLGKLEEAQAHAKASRALAAQGGDCGSWPRLLALLARIAKLRHDPATARAYLGESYELVRGDKSNERHIHETLADVALYQLDFDLARAALDHALGTGEPLSLDGALSLVNIARRKPSPGDEAALRRAAEQLSTGGDAGQRALLNQLLGRFYIQRDRQKGRTFLQNVLRDVTKLPAATLENNTYARRARSDAYAELILDGGKHGEHAMALDLFGEELGFRAPSRCVMAFTEDAERTTVVVRGANGELLGRYDGARPQPLAQDPSGLVPAEALSSLRGCAQVDVLARPPLHGLPGVLPPELAWSYRTRADRLRPHTGTPVRLVVSDITYLPERNMAALHWTTRSVEGETLIELGENRATPDAVLAEMARANEIDLSTHGVIDPSSGSHFLYLARDRNGEDRLTIPRIRKGPRLEGAPFIVLAACSAANPSPVYHEPVSLPMALLEKGARGVLAATTEIPDMEANIFFDAVRARMRRGEEPAVALRDERMSWRQRNLGTEWVDRVLLFE